MARSAGHWLERGSLGLYLTLSTPAIFLMRLPFSSAILLLALSPISQAVITSYGADFNSGAGSLTGFFLRTGDNAAAGVAWNATAGVGGGGGVLVTNGAADNFFYRPSPPDNTTSAFNFSALTAGQGYSSSADFLWSNSTSTDLTSINVGFSPGRASNALSGATDGFISGSLIRNGSDTVQLRIRNNNATPFTESFDQSPPDGQPSTIVANNWYRLTFQMTMNANGSIDNLVTLYSIGLDGLAAPVQVSSVSGNVINPGLLASTEVFSAYDIRNVSSNGIDAVDNLNVSFIPEPSAMALAALGGVAVMARRRRC